MGEGGSDGRSDNGCRGAEVVDREAPVCRGGECLVAVGRYGEVGKGLLRCILSFSYKYGYSRVFTRGAVNPTLKKNEGRR